jgi:hypothetical protein
MRRLAFAAFFLPSLLSAQAILQQSIAAGAGTTAGAILGKQVSKALDVVMGATKEAEGVEPTDHKKRDEWKRLATGGARPAARLSPAEGKDIAAPAGPAAPSSALTRVRSGAQPIASARVSPSFGGSVWFPFTLGSVRESRSSGAAPPEMTAEDLHSISQGAARDEVVEKLGTPMARVTIPEEGRFVEVYYYQNRGETLGAVRLDDGAVSEVQLAR